MFLEKLQESAKSNPDAAFCLADAYKVGCTYYGKRKVRVRKNKRLAFHWMHHAAQLGNTSAMCHLAGYYTNGYGCEKSLIDAIKWEKKAFRMGDTSVAAHNVGCSYRMMRKYKLALRWFQKSYTSFDKASALDIGKCHLFGQGVKKNMRIALRYFREIADVDTFPLEKEHAIEFIADIRGGIPSANLPSVRRIASPDAAKRIRFYKDELRRSPKNEAACYCLVRFCFHNKRHEEGLLFLEDSLKSMDEADGIRMGEELAEICFNLKDGYNELAVYRILTHRYPQNPMVWNNVAACHMDFGQCQEALMLLQKALALDPLRQYGCIRRNINKCERTLASKEMN